MKTGTIVTLSVLGIGGAAYAIGRKKAKDQGYATSPFLATIYGVPHMAKKKAEIRGRIKPTAVMNLLPRHMRGAPTLSASPNVGKSCMCKNAAGEFYESVKDEDGNCICGAGFSHVTRGATMANDISNQYIRAITSGSSAARGTGPRRMRRLRR